MAIQAAIFDCDGTLLDSMPMWEASCVELLERHGVANAREVFLEHESLDMDKKCFWYHDNLGIGRSGEALYRELWRTVERAYLTTVEPFEGCRDLLKELRAAGIPMVIASSTPTRLLRSALISTGLLDYFDSLIFAGDVGRGKEHPDVYLAACKRLGTDRASTWVFEDAPFGVRSAARAGFPVAAIYNDHDGRDVNFLQRWATIFSDGYADLSFERLASTEPRTLDALIVAGSPEPTSAEHVAALSREADVVIAADRGMDVLVTAGVVPDALVGDEDSMSSSSRAWASEHGVAVERHPTEKDDTDLGLAIRRARALAEQQTRSLRVTLTCASGGRIDHQLGVFGVLARNTDVCPRVAEDAFTCHILSPLGKRSLKIAGQTGSTVSVVALSSDAVVTERGLRWELESEHLELLDDRGVSNVVVQDDAFVCCEAGVVAVFVRA